MTRRAWMRLRPWKRHSLVLAVAGMIYLLIGISYITLPMTTDRASTMRFMLALAPIDAWGAAWVVVGGLAFASTRWPPASETWGYTALSGLSAAWSLFYGFGVLFFGAPYTALSGMLAWGLFAFFYWAIAGLRNPDDVPMAGREGP